MQRIKKGDVVIVIAGKCKKQQGKVLKIFADKNRAIVEGINLASHYVRANPQKEITGGIYRKEATIHMSNLALYNPVTKRADKIKMKQLENGEHVRVFKSNEELVDV